MRISVGDDGYTTLVPLGEDGTAVQRDAVTVGLSPLPGSDRAFVIWFPQGIGSDISPAESSYGLLLRAEQEYRIAFPNCESDEQIATAAGAEVEGETIRLCRFRSRAQLEETFGRYAASASVMFRLVRRGGG